MLCIRCTSHVSVTSPSSTKTAKCRITQTKPYDFPIFPNNKQEKHNKHPETCKTSQLLNISCIHYFRTWFTHSINNCGNIRCDILLNVYGHVVIVVDQSHAFRIFHSAFYFPRPVWARGRCRISPPRFLADCCKRQLNQGSFVLLYFRLSIFFWFVLSLFICIFLYCFVCQYQSSDWMWRPPLKWPILCRVGR